MKPNLSREEKEAKQEMPGVVEKEGEIANKALISSSYGSARIIDDLCDTVRPQNPRTGPP